MYTTTSQSTTIPDPPRTVRRNTTPIYKGRFSTKLDCTRNSRQSKLSSLGIAKSFGEPPVDKCRILTASRRATTAIVHMMKITSPHKGKVISIVGMTVLIHFISVNRLRDATEAVDPLTGEAVSLFNPRKQKWSEHFAWNSDSTRVEGITAIGRATIVRLRMNNQVIIVARRRWLISGWHPPAD